MDEISEAKGKRGRKKYHAERPNDVQIIRALILAVKKIKVLKNLDNNGIRKMIEKFGITAIFPKDSFYKECVPENFVMRTGQIDAFLDERGANDGVIKSFKFFLETEKEFVQLYRECKTEAILELQEPFVKSVRSLLGFDNPIDQTDADVYGGVYKLYRPFYMRPRDAILLCRFEIGLESAFDCKFSTHYQEERVYDHVTIGKLILHGSDHVRLSAITADKNKKGPSHFMFHFDDLTIEHDGLYQMSGIMIASYGGKDSSAWPVFAIKAQERESWKPGIIESDQFGTIPNEAWDRLNRGAVYWHPDQYTKVFSSKI